MVVVEVPRLQALIRFYEGHIAEAAGQQEDEAPDMDSVADDFDMERHKRD